MMLKIQSNKKKQRNNNKKTIRRNNCCYCYQCDSWKGTNEFYPQQLTTCKICAIKTVTNRKNTLSGFIRALRHNAEKTSKERSCNSTKHHSRDEFTLTMDDMFQILTEQNFRCKYSKIP
eukprot:27040_1